MKFTSTLIKGKLIKRYKRFFVDIKVNNSILTAHCPNTGSMMGLLDQGNDVWITKNDNPNRKLKFTLEMIKVDKKLIGVNTHRANRIVEHGLKNKLFNEFKLIKKIKPEFKFSSDTRFDFLCDKNIIEVKNVTFFTSIIFLSHKKSNLVSFENLNSGLINFTFLNSLKSLFFKPCSTILFAL